MPQSPDNAFVDTPDAHADAAETPPSWNLDDLYASPDDPQITVDLTALAADAAVFAERFQGKVADLDSAELADAIRLYEALMERATLPGTYAGLRFSADTAPQNGAFLQSVRERTTSATLPLLFFPIELGNLASDRLDNHASAPELSTFTHYLKKIRARAPHRLSEPEERIFEERANTGRRAFARLHTELVAGLRTEIDGKSQSLSATMSRLYDPSRDIRHAAADAITASLTPHARTLSFIYNTLIQDKAVEDRLRRYPTPEASRHLDNELDPAISEMVASVAEEGHALVNRYYHAKRARLGLSELTHADRYAPLSTDARTVGWGDAKTLILDAFAGFDPKVADAAREFFDDGWIDAAPRDGKAGGAFCNSILPRLHPVILMSYRGTISDVRTLAHELGHGVHGYFARSQRYLNFHGTLPIAEVASTFAEQHVFAALDRAAVDSTERAALYAEQIESAFSTIHRQIALYRFEQAAHAARKNGELSVEQFGALWQEKIGGMFGDSVRFGEGHALWWSYVPHFIGVPFYVYAYSFGLMLALALYHRWQQEGDEFAARYIGFLADGGSKNPYELVAPLGVDLADPNFWRGALKVLEAHVDRFETLA